MPYHRLAMCWGTTVGSNRALFKHGGLGIIQTIIQVAGGMEGMDGIRLFDALEMNSGTYPP